MRESLRVGDLVAQGALLVEDGNHGEYRPRPHEFVEDGVPFIRAADMSSGVVDFASAGKIDDAARARIRKGIGRPGDVLLSHKGTVGRIAVAPANSPDYVCSPQTTFWRSLDPTVIDQRYLAYVLRSAAFVSQLNYLKSQTDMAPYVSLTDQRSMTLSLPAISEQRAIAEVLGALDDKIAANARKGSTAMSLARLLYTSALSGTPECAMSSVLTPVLGGTPSRTRDDYWAGSRPWASAKDVTGAHQGVIFHTEEQITDLAVEETKAKPLQSGGVILTARGTVGAVARVAQPTSFNQSCYGFEPGVIPPASLYFVVLESTTRARAMVHGSVFDTITTRTFDHLSVPSLSATEWAQLEARIAPLLNLTNATVEESLQLAKTRDALLPGLMSGAIRVKDAEQVVGEAV